MQCSVEILQVFLDGELEAAESEAVRRHLARCPACRSELARLRLLWLELEQDEAVEIPWELPLIRQQAISMTRAFRRERETASGSSFLAGQKLAWQCALDGVTQIPGSRQMMSLARAAGNGLPVVLKGAASVLVKMAGRRRDKS